MAKGKYRRKNEAKNNRSEINLLTTKLVAAKKKVDESDVFDKELLIVHSKPVKDIVMYLDQEDINEKKVEDLIAKWDIRQFKIPEVGEFVCDYGDIPKGTLMMGAGHHRLAVFKRFGLDEIPCHIIPVRSKAEVAEIFLNDAENNEDASKTHAEKWASKVREGRHKHVIEIDNTMKRYRLSFGDKSKNRVIKSYDTVLWIEDNLGIKTLDTTFYILDQLYQCNKISLQANFFKALAIAIYQGREKFDLDVNRMIYSIRKREDLSIKKIVDKMKQTDHGETVPYEKRVEITFGKIYNHAKRDNLWPGIPRD